ncbi:MAG: hypothetical protein JXB46_05695, partial [Candidatus Eisenbacteria bacterium]|nr:hypothetical protein [Candidatus Eisenbacteria bacterium]
EVSASRLMQAEPGLFYISATLHEGVSPEEGEITMLDVISRVRESGLTESELTKARNLTRVDALLSLESCLGSAGAYAFWESLGSWRLEEAYEEGLTAAASETVRSAAVRYLSPDMRSSAWLVP